MVLNEYWLKVDLSSNPPEVLSGNVGDRLSTIEKKLMIEGIPAVSFQFMGDKSDSRYLKVQDEGMIERGKPIRFVRYLREKI